MRCGMHLLIVTALGFVLAWGRHPLFGQSQLNPTGAPSGEQKPQTIAVRDSDALQRALETAPDGAEITLAPGEYVLTKPVSIGGRSISLRGAGMEKTQIVLRLDGWGITFLGEGKSFLAQDIAFKYDGVKDGTIFSALSGSVRLNRCLFTGVIGEVSSAIALGPAEARISQCKVVDNQGCGLMVIGGSSVVVEQSVFEQNFVGVMIMGDSRVTLRNNTCRRNQKAGIAVFDQSQATIENNTCTGNSGGIVIRDNAKVKLTGNQSFGNMFGVVLSTTAQVSLSNNKWYGNSLQDVSRE